jgi:hypothetical protein
MQGDPKTPKPEIAPPRVEPTGPRRRGIVLPPDEAGERLPDSVEIDVPLDPEADIPTEPEIELPDPAGLPDRTGSLDAPKGAAPPP